MLKLIVLKTGLGKSKFLLKVGVKADKVKGFNSRLEISPRSHCRHSQLTDDGNWIQDNKILTDNEIMLIWVSLHGRVSTDIVFRI